MSEQTPVRRVQRVRHETQRRELTVTDVRRRDGRFVVVTLQGESLRSFMSSSFDDHVKLMLPDPEAGDGGMLMRDYTPRAFDTQRGELVLEFAVHGSGPFSGWAEQAAPGQTLTVAGPRGSMVIPMDYDWHWLVGDDTAWPAIARRLEELPAEARVSLWLLMDDLPTLPARRPAALDLHLVATPEALLQGLRGATLPVGEGFVWCAGEAQTMAQARELLLRDKGHPKEALNVAAYWKAGAVAYHARLGEEATA